MATKKLMENMRMFRFKPSALFRGILSVLYDKNQRNGSTYYPRGYNLSDVVSGTIDSNSKNFIVRDIWPGDIEVIEYPLDEEESENKILLSNQRNDVFIIFKDMIYASEYNDLKTFIEEFMFKANFKLPTSGTYREIISQQKSRIEISFGNGVKGSRSLVFGTKPVSSMERLDWDTVSDTVITPKADGVRANLVCCKTCCYLVIDNGPSPIVLAIESSPDNNKDVYDGEVMITQDKLMFYIFDVVYPRNVTQMDWGGRKSYIDKFIVNNESSMGHIVKMKETITETSVKRAIEKAKNHKWRTGAPVETDGFILYPSNTRVGGNPFLRLDSTIHPTITKSGRWDSQVKLKPSEKASVDVFLTSNGEGDGKYRIEVCGFSGFKSVEEASNYTGELYGRISFPGFVSSEEEYKEGTVYEVVLKEPYLQYKSPDQELVVIRARDDKTSANDIKTVENTLSPLYEPSSIGNIGTEYYSKSKSLSNMLYPLKRMHSGLTKKFIVEQTNQVIGRCKPRDPSGGRHVVNLSVLDLGCGTGKDLRTFVYEKFRNYISVNYTGVDADKENILGSEGAWKTNLEKAKKYRSIRNFHFDVYDFNNTQDTFGGKTVAGKRFDLTMALFSLHYANNTRNFLKMVLEHMKPKGSFIGTFLDSDRIDRGGFSSHYDGNTLMDVKIEGEEEIDVLLGGITDQYLKEKRLRGSELRALSLEVGFKRCEIRRFKEYQSTDIDLTYSQLMPPKKDLRSKDKEGAGKGLIEPTSPSLSDALSSMSGLYSTFVMTK